MLINGNTMFFSNIYFGKPVVLPCKAAGFAGSRDLEKSSLALPCLAVCLWQNIQYSHLSMKNHWQLEMEAVVCLMSMRSNGETLV